MIPSLAAVLVFTLAPQAPSAGPAAKCTNVEGDFVAHVVSEAPCPPNGLCTAGELTGGLKGKYEFHITKAPIDAGSPAPATVKFFVGQSTVTLVKGGTLTGIDSGAIDMPPGQGGFASIITWTNGATGQIRVNGTFDRKANATKGEYEGTVCRPR